MAQRLWRTAKLTLRMERAQEGGTISERTQRIADNMMQAARDAQRRHEAREQRDAETDS